MNTAASPESHAAGARHAASRTPISFETPHRFIDVGHSRVAAWSFGTGPDVVFVHGWPVSAATFRHVVRELSSDFTCHLIDLPGAGRTETTRESPIDLHAHAVTLRSAIDALGLSRYALCAHDSGAFVARIVAAEDPRVIGAVLSNTEIAGHTPLVLAGFILMARTRMGSSLLPLILRSKTIRHSRLGFGGCFEDPRYADGDFHDLFVRPLIESPRALEGALDLLRSVGPKTLAGLRSLHARIRVPVKLIWGADDPWFPLAKARPMLRELGGEASLVEIPGGKLFVHEDHAEEFAGHARTFLSRCFASSFGRESPLGVAS